MKNDAREARIIEALAASDTPMAMPDIAKAIGEPERDVDRTLRRLRAKKRAKLNPFGRYLLTNEERTRRRAGEVAPAAAEVPDAEPGSTPGFCSQVEFAQGTSNASGANREVVIDGPRQSGPECRNCAHWSPAIGCGSSLGWCHASRTEREGHDGCDRHIDKETGETSSQAAEKAILRSDELEDAPDEGLPRVCGYCASWGDGCQPEDTVADTACDQYVPRNPQSVEHLILQAAERGEALDVVGDEGLFRNEVESTHAELDDRGTPTTEGGLLMSLPERCRSAMRSLPDRIAAHMADRAALLAEIETERRELGNREQELDDMLDAMAGVGK
jgi:hypothetical protein